MAKIEFQPTLKEVKTSGGKTRFVLEIEKHKIAESLGDLSLLEGGKITASFRPETVAYKVKYNKVDNKPAERYDQDKDGNWDKFIEEQTSLIGEEEFENREFRIELEVVDEFIVEFGMKGNGDAPAYEILNELKEGRSFEAIGLDYDLSGEDLEQELSEAREKYAPYAATWDEKRKKENK